MAKTFESGAAVGSGYYLNLSRWHVEPVERDGGRLPAGGGKWIPVPTAAALALVPIMGALFLMFLPVIGFALTFRALASPVLGVFKTSAGDLAATMSPGWRPGEAHFTGKESEHAGVEEKGPPATNARLEELEREIAKRRNS